MPVVSISNISVTATGTLTAKLNSSKSGNSERIARLLEVRLKDRLLNPRTPNRQGLSKGGAANGEFPHYATGTTWRSIRAEPGPGAVWQVSVGGNAQVLEYGQRAFTPNRQAIRAWALIKFPGLASDQKALNRLVNKVSRQVAKNGLRATNFFSRTVEEFRKELRGIKTMRGILTLAAAQKMQNALIAQTSQIKRTRKNARRRAVARINRAAAGGRSVRRPRRRRS